MEWCKIIVVDDEYLLRQGIMHMLDWEKYGFSMVGEATNATQTLELIEEVHPHIILCDIVMPNIDGIELSKIIKKRYPDIEIIILSGYDNFDYVKTAFKYGVADYVLKPTLTAEQLLDILLPLQKKFVTPMQNIERYNDIGKQLLRMFEDQVMDDHLLEGYFIHDDFTMIGYQLLNDQFVDHHLVVEKIQHVFKDYHIVDVGQSEEVHLFIIHHDYKERIKINHKWEALTHYFEAKILSVFLMKIDRVKGVENLLRGYNELKYLSQYFFYGYEKQHMSITLGSLKRTQILQFDIQGFMQKAVTDPISALDSLGEYLNGLTYHNGLKSTEVKAIVQNSIYNILNSLLAKDDRFKDMNTKKIMFFNKISIAHTLKEVIISYHEIYDEIKSLIGTDTSSKMMKKIVEYIGINYNEQISLQEIAKELHISYSYLSAYFNQHFNESFNDYLNGVRIEKAKEFLVDPAVQISYVSEMVGYSSPGYFTKVFKKLTAVTPSAYRRKNMK